MSDSNHNTNSSANGHSPLLNGTSGTAKIGAYFHEDSNSTSDMDSRTVVNDFDNNHTNSADYLASEGRFSDLMTLNDYDLPTNNSNLKKYGLNASMRQLHYSENKLALDNLINKTVDIIYELVNENKSRPIFYPTSSDVVKGDRSLKSYEKSKIGSEDPVDFKILSLNLQLSPKDMTNGINSLDKSSISILLDQKLNQQVKLLLNLKDRIDDTSSKVFVTGDLNAGKSTFCNALLRRKVLPEDQQPLTSVFCEIIDASKENNSIEEVHAIPVGVSYDIRDESSYQVFQLSDLENLVEQLDKYSLIKIYLNDVRPKEQSLLCNGVIDIRLIDAPGLNMDSYQTTQVFSRQEEIDLVVFVVNSENHFTLSGKEFIGSAAGEKQYLFIVSNKFDNIRDKEKCKQKILEQLKTLSPESYKDSKDFVHFVSSSDVLDNSNGGDGGDDGPDDNGFSNPDFDNLEASLRKFVLEKRAISKLLPAKNFLINILSDIKSLASVNQNQYLKEKESMLKELQTTIEPHYDNLLNKSIVINDSILKVIEDTCTSIYQFTKREMNDSIDNLGDSQIVPYMGIQFAYEYAMETQSKMVDSIISSVSMCEENAKVVTTQRVDEIIKYGQENLDEEFLSNKKFQSDLMFKRRKDIIRKSLLTPIEFYDFFDPLIESCLTWIGLPNDLVSNGLNHLSNYNPTSIITKLPMRAITLREQLPSQLTLQTIYSSTKILTVGALVRKIYSISNYLTLPVIKQITIPLVVGITGFGLYYLISDIPNAYPRKQARRIKAQIQDLDYVHNNGDRIAKECRKVLNYPLRQVMNNFQTSIDKRNQEKIKIESRIKDANISLSYFDDLIEKIDHEYKLVKDINLENVNTVD